ncbi:MAG: hypothetical protein KAW92_09010 [Candidatus Cloacimonetes bacterium]|nr:hypothetical protein [Candidatus Cloacimonadota bacterium]
MQKPIMINKILYEITKLAFSEKLELLDNLVKQIKKQELNKKDSKYTLLQLKGLGKELWQEVDVENYINTERDQWDVR